MNKRITEKEFTKMVHDKMSEQKNVKYVINVIKKNQ